MKDLPQNLAAIMEERGLTPEATARAVGMSAKLLVDVLAGRKVLFADQIPKFCDVLRCKPNHLFGYDPYCIVVQTEAGEPVATISGNVAIEREGYRVIDARTKKEVERSNGKRNGKLSVDSGEAGRESAGERTSVCIGCWKNAWCMPADSFKTVQI